MVLKLYGFPFSTCTRRVATALHEKQVPFELVVVDLATGAHKDPAFVEKQPFGQVPYIDDDGFVLFESRAIFKYIATKYAAQGTPDLVPVPTAGVTEEYVKALATFEQAASIEQSNFDAFAASLSAEKVFLPRRGIPTNEAHVEWLLKTWEGKLDAYDKILSKQKYLAGDYITAVDLFHLPYGALASSPAVGVDFTAGRPNLARWWADITSRPSWKAVGGASGVASIASY